jgi:hypothetical protein
MFTKLHFSRIFFSFSDARYHPYSTPNTSKSSSSPSSVNDTSVQSDQHPPMTSSPCSSSVDEPTTFVQQIYSTKYNNDDNEESACSSKENFVPLTYYSDAIATNIEGDNDYDTITNGIYSSTTMQSNENFSYTSKLKKLFRI